MKNQREKDIPLWKLYCNVIFLWRELSHMATPSYMAIWELQSVAGTKMWGWVLALKKEGEGEREGEEEEKEEEEREEEEMTYLTEPSEWLSHLSAL